MAGSTQRRTYSPHVCIDLMSYPSGQRQILRLILALILAAKGGWAFAFRSGEPPGFDAALSQAALGQLDPEIRYDPAYRQLSYPGGDVPAHLGVCTDVVIRAYRELGIDLQVDVHEEMRRHFDVFPRNWGLRGPDPNIDHRRVPNLEVYFMRRGESLPISDRAEDYLPGDLVTWSVGGRPHIGIVVNRRKDNRYQVVHNIGQGVRCEDLLFVYQQTGHYRYYGPIVASDGDAPEAQ